MSRLGKITGNGFGNMLDRCGPVLFLGSRGSTPTRGNVQGIWIDGDPYRLANEPPMRSPGNWALFPGSKV
jgi:hypothetical protein